MMVRFLLLGNVLEERLSWLFSEFFLGLESTSKLFGRFWIFFLFLGVRVFFRWVWFLLAFLVKFIVC